MVSEAELLPLKGTFQNYAWGKEISDSIFASFLDTQSEKPQKGTVAELWLGSHPNGESEVKIKESWIPLKQHLKQCAADTSKLDFLTKILCINQPLSIQLHPDTNEALKLHLQDPQNFPDSNPKPEMAIALSDVKLLCGVRPLDDLINLIEDHVAFSSTATFNPIEALESGGVAKLFEVILSLSNDELSRVANIFKSNEPKTAHDKISTSIVSSTNTVDAGILALHLLSYHEVKKGEAIYVKPNIPHAYISGEAFECMKNSDNVVRGGLTSKTIDIKNFCRLVETVPYDPKLNALKVCPYLDRYQNNDLPFIVDHLEIKTDKITTVELGAVEDHEIFLVVTGNGSIQHSNKEYELKPGSSFYSYKRNSIAIHGKDLMLFRISAK